MLSQRRVFLRLDFESMTTLPLGANAGKKFSIQPTTQASNASGSR